MRFIEGAIIGFLSIAAYYMFYVYDLKKNLDHLKYKYNTEKSSHEYTNKLYKEYSEKYGELLKQQEHLQRTQEAYDRLAPAYSEMRTSYLELKEQLFQLQEEHDALKDRYHNVMADFEQYKATHE